MRGRFKITNFLKLSFFSCCSWFKQKASPFGEMPFSFLIWIKPVFCNGFSKATAVCCFCDLHSGNPDIERLREHVSFEL